MSFLCSRAQPAFRTLAIARPFAPRLFHSTATAQKSAPDVIKDTVKNVDRKVSDAAVAGIEKGREAAAKVSEVAGMKTGQSQDKAHEMAGGAKGKADEMAGEVTGKAKELKHEAAGKMKGSAEEVKGKL